MTRTLVLVAALLAVARTGRADVKLEHVHDTGTATSRTLRYGLAFTGEGLHLLLTEAPIKCDTQSDDVRGWVIGVEADGSAEVMESSSEGATIPADKVKLARKPVKGRVAGTIAFDHEYREPLTGHTFHYRAAGSFDVLVCKP